MNLSPTNLDIQANVAHSRTMVEARTQLFLTMSWRGARYIHGLASEDVASLVNQTYKTLIARGVTEPSLLDVCSVALLGHNRFEGMRVVFSEGTKWAEAGTKCVEAFTLVKPMPTLLSGGTEIDTIVDAVGLTVAVAPACGLEGRDGDEIVIGNLEGMDPHSSDVCGPNWWDIGNAGA